MAIEQLAAEIRRHFNDPTNPIYKDRPDLREQAELHVRASLIGAGVADAPVTAEQLAEQRHDASFSQRTMNAGLAAMLDGRMAALADAHSPEKLAAMAGSAREHVGADAYDAMVADARLALAGEPPKAALADLTVLRAIAAQGRYLRRYRETKPR